MSTRLPTLPGKVHGIVSTNPLGVQCDGCLEVFTSDWPIEAVKAVPFNKHVPGTRKCTPCWRAAGWVDGYWGWEQTT